ncbi:toll/interleukin-1 receptor domain-containing protein [Sphingomonas jaspsi]|uniref:toll/interleukin-1 receptor domain-containing protein n=1 Tax=Sphingomonas jaspsi TaxID=392409 RepID=UPI0004B29A86|nr:toll/interleukin-1 receptor domain-containing protein [Sphingomonas jaspsi]
MGGVAQFWAFLSYSHRDRRWANWLHHALETYRVPARLVGRDGPAGPIPARLSPIFRDREELAASSDLGERLGDALRNSKFLVVLCSPSAASSQWTNQEIVEFKRAHGDQRILAAIVDGEPFASAMPGREAEECFPPALRFKIDADGKLTDERSEPIAADFRESGDGKRMAKLKLVAGMLGVGLDELVQRDQQRRQRRLAWLAAASVAGMAVTSGLAVAAVRARHEAEYQRGQSDSLVEFMLTDLRAKLEPVGRLDALDAVGERALHYYGRQDVADLSADELGHRSKALNLVGEVRNLRGDMAGSMRAFAEAARTTGEQLRRDPDDPQRNFDHAQSMFWVGYYAWQTGDRAQARRDFEQYRALAGKLVAIDPKKPEWQAEVAYAETNLGVLRMEAGDGAGAVGHFKAAERVWRALGGDKPGNRDMSYQLAQSLAWQADAYRSAGDSPKALAVRRAESGIYRLVLAKAPDDYEMREGLTVSQSRLAQLMLDVGMSRAAFDLARSANRDAEALLQRDSKNALWKEMAAKSRNILAEIAIVNGDLPTARSANHSAAALCQELVDTGKTVEKWRSDCLAPARWMAALIDVRTGDASGGIRLAQDFQHAFAKPPSVPSQELLFGQVMARLIAAKGTGGSGAAQAGVVLASMQIPKDARLRAAANYLSPSSQAPSSYPLASLMGTEQ